MTQQRNKGCNCSIHSPFLWRNTPRQIDHGRVKSEKVIRSEATRENRVLDVNPSKSMVTKASI